MPPPADPGRVIQFIPSVLSEALDDELAASPTRLVTIQMTGGWFLKTEATKFNGAEGTTEGDENSLTHSLL